MIVLHAIHRWEHNLRGTEADLDLVSRFPHYYLVVLELRKADQIHPDSPRPKPLPLVSKFIFPMLIVCSLLVGACQNMKGTTAGGRDPFSSVGVAFMEEDGSLTVRLRAEGTIHGRKEVGDAAFYYNKGDKDYWRIIKHVGGLKPGESKPVPPWPESASL